MPNLFDCVREPPGLQVGLTAAPPPRQSRLEETLLKGESRLSLTSRRVDGTSALKVLAAFVLPCRQVDKESLGSLTPK